MSKFMKKAFIADADVNEAEVIHATVDIELLQEACDVSWLALTKYRSEGEMARYIKQCFDRNHGASWQCIVGKTFGSYVSVDSKFFVHIHIGRTAILLYKTYAKGEYEKIADCLEDRIV
uniref:Dynein light chain n=1 Tax=Panagrolaimus superbus TaxID=310955 RepID=A0A914Y548_9BILA